MQIILGTFELRIQNRVKDKTYLNNYAELKFIDPAIREMD